ncbi:MAG TPA: murein biosynthesis integral membrane protein MurJ [Candidatus Saccharimonadales bacterium]|nr:murein biosynthesis integral membrane protein MurJ [Candidatus Saccharimonadales bacterium]
MQEKPSSQTKKRIPLSKVALLLITTALLGQLLGFLRTKLVNANFPALGPNSTDAYFAAFNIPDFFFYTLAAGALGVAFMPVLAERLQKGDRHGMWEISSSLLNLLAMVMGVVSLVIFFGAGPLIHYVVAPNMSPQQLHNAVVIMRFLALNPLFFTISGILSSVQQSLGRFFFYAIAPLFYNLSIIASIYVFKDTSFGLKGLGLGALVGGLLQLLMVCVGLYGTKFSWRPTILWRSSDFRMILKNLPPRSLDQGMDQIQSIVETNFARRLGPGNVSYYNNANILQTAPVLLLGTAISTAAFPRLSNRLAQGRPDLFNRDFLSVVRVLLWLAFPVVIISYFARGYLARLIFSRDAPQVALIFGFLSIAIFAGILYTILSRWFYARKDTRTPLFVSVFTVGLNIVLAILLARPSSYGIAGLALSQSIASTTEVVLLLGIMLLRDHRLLNRVFWEACGRIISVSGFSLFAGYLAVSFFPLGINDRGFLTLGTKLTFIALVTFGVHILMSGLFDLDETRPIFQGFKRLALKPLKIFPY